MGKETVGIGVAEDSPQKRRDKSGIELVSAKEIERRWRDPDLWSRNDSGGSAKFTPVYTPREIGRNLKRKWIALASIWAVGTVFYYLILSTVTASDGRLFDFTLGGEWRGWVILVLVSIIMTRLIYGFFLPTYTYTRSELEDMVKCSACGGTHSLKEIRALQAARPNVCAACLHETK